ncbi:MAG: MoaD/ThiS family protein [Acidimicrobiales bacterium]
MTLRYFAAARDAAGTGGEVSAGTCVADVLDRAIARHGARFGEVLGGCRVWVNSAPAGPELVLNDGDEVAVLPPVSGGCLR